MSLGRLLTAMVTPFDEALRVDYGAARRLAARLVDAGSQGVVVCGTTGEAPTLSVEEKKRLFREVKEELGARASVVANTGTYCTEESVELTQAAARLGVDAAMAVVPYYNNPPQEGLFRHFKAIADATPLPLILYNVPSRSPRNLEADTVVRLADACPNIRGVKEAGGNMEQVEAIVQRTPNDFVAYSGDDAITLAVMQRGGVGVISVASHVAGPAMRRMIDAFHDGRLDEAAAIDARLQPLFKALFATTNPILVKAALDLAGFPCGGLRLPLVHASAAEREALRPVLERVLDLLNA